MSTRVLYIHVPAVGNPNGVTSLDLAPSVIVGLDDGDPIVETPTIVINLKTLGIYKTAIQMNLALADAVKQFMLDEHSIPINGYAATYVSGAYGLLNIL